MQNGSLKKVANHDSDEFWKNISEEVRIEGNLAGFKTKFDQYWEKKKKKKIK